MEYVPHILGVVALLIAAFTFLKMGGAMARIRALEKRNRKVEDDLKAMKEDSRKGGRTPSQDNNRREPRAGQTTMPPGREPRQGQERQPQPEGRQKQPREQAARGQQPNEPRANQGQPQQPRQPQQEPRQKQEPREPQQPKQGREQRQPQEPKTPQEPRQPQEGRQKQPRQPQLDADGQPIARPPQNQRRNEGQRRQAVNEQQENQLGQPASNQSLAQGMVGDDLLNELTQQQPEAPVSRTRYAVIPEDGLVKTHQLQQQPDSDSYLEIDAPQEGSTTTKYRFNVKGNQAFVISQGMDRLENAFEFEKPSNRMVSRILVQGDGVLTRTTSGWKIQQKARIDFR